MDEDKIRLVQRSFERLIPISANFAAQFYKKLFELSPEARLLFKGDMKMQEQKIMASMMMLVLGLDNLEGMLSSLKSLGRRHVGYGVKPKYYPIVEKALISTMENILGDSFTTQHKEAWQEIYAIISKIMIESADEKEEGGQF